MLWYTPPKVQNVFSGILLQQKSHFEPDYGLPGIFVNFHFKVCTHIYFLCSPKSAFIAVGTLSVTEVHQTKRWASEHRLMISLFRCTIN